MAMVYKVRADVFVVNSFKTSRDHIGIKCKIFSKPTGADKADFSW
jgi:hypothetical protein